MIDNKKSEIRNYIRELKKQFPLEEKNKNPKGFLRN